MAAILQAPIHPELKRLLGEEADERGLAMNELLAQLLAERYNRPDLAAIPRKKMGRPRKLAEAV